MDITTLLFDQETVTRIALKAALRDGCTDDCQRALVKAYNEGYAEGYAEGLAERFAEGFAKGEKNIVRGAVLESLNQHIDPDFICQFLKISKEEYDEIVLNAAGQIQHSKSS